MSEERRPSSDTVEIDRRELLAAMVERGEAVVCPACSGDGCLSPRLAARIRTALPIPEDRPTLPDVEKP